MKQFTLLLLLSLTFNLWGQIEKPETSTSIEAFAKKYIQVLQKQDKNGYLDLLPSASVIAKISNNTMEGKDEEEIGKAIPKLQERLGEEFDQILKAAKREKIKLKLLKFEQVEIAGSANEYKEGITPLNIYFSYKGKFGSLSVATVEHDKRYLLGTMNTYDPFDRLENQLLTDLDRGYGPDSTNVALRLKEMRSTFEKSKGKAVVAEFIVYRGDDEARKWKTTCNYAVAEEKRQVNLTSDRVNRTLNAAEDFQIVAYEYDRESEGVWHVLTVHYQLDGEAVEERYAFLKINGKYALGDID